MNITYRITRTLPVQINLNFLFVLLVKLTAALPHLSHPNDDSAAKRYAANKYGGDID